MKWRLLRKSFKTKSPSIGRYLKWKRIKTKSK